MTARALVTAALAVLTGCAISGPAGDYSVGGTVSGLSTNGGVLLTDAAGAGVFVSSDGRFSIDNAFVDGSAYDVAVSTDPGAPSFRCHVSHGKGVIAGSDVNDVVVDCAPQAFEVGGSVSGVDAVGLVLASRGAEVAVSRDGTFTFPGKITNGSSYAVSIEQQPERQTCTITNGSGVVDGANVRVSVTCGPSEEAEEETSNP
ncbi:MAG: hypothetical protein U0270_05900 [Labilithrix sp.]